MFTNEIGDKGLEDFSKGNFENLEKFDLRNNKIGDKGAEFLSKGSFPNLTQLLLEGNKTIQQYFSLSDEIIPTPC